MSLLEISHINTGYGKKQVLFDVSLKIEEGEILLLVGSNGSGKSTLLKTVYGLLDIWESHGLTRNSNFIKYNGEKLHEYGRTTPTHKLIQKGMMYIPQKDALFEDMTVRENLEASLLHLGNKTESEKRIAEVIEKVPLLASRQKQLAGQMSGGERKLLSLGMVLVNQPKLLLLDEPLAGLSEGNIPGILEIMQKMKKNGTTIVIVEHRIKEMITFADRVVGLKLGVLSTDNLNTIENIKEFMI